MTVAALAALFAARSAAVWLVATPVLEPDTGLYAQGGLGLFPSPLGRLLGVGGLEAIAVANVAAGFLLVLGVAELARARGGRPLLAAALVNLAPLGVWSIFAGMDTIAAAALVWAYVELERGRVRRSAGLAAVGAGFHLAAILVVAAALLWRRSVGLVLVVGAISVGLAAATPYRGVLLELHPWVVATSAVATGLVFVLTFAPFALRLGAAVPAIAGGALAAGVVSASAWETNCRYMLPAVAVGAAASTTTRRASSDVA